MLNLKNISAASANSAVKQSQSIRIACCVARIAWECKNKPNLPAGERQHGLKPILQNLCGFALRLYRILDFAGYEKTNPNCERDIV